MPAASGQAPVESLLATRGECGGVVLAPGPVRIPGPDPHFFTALDEQTVVVPGTAAAIVPSLAGSLQAVLDQRKLLAHRIEQLVEANPLSEVLMSMPSIGIRTGARIFIDIGDGTAFPSRPTSLLTPTSLQQPETPGPRSTANSPPDEETSSSREPSPSPRSPHEPIIRPREPLPRQTPGRRPLRHAPRRNLLRTPANLSWLTLSGLAARGAVPLVDRVHHHRMTTEVARPHALARRLPNRHVITHDSHTVTRPP